MASARRRSSRLRGATPESRRITPVTAAKLSSLLERDETPDLGPQSNLDAIVSSPTQVDTVAHNPISSPVKTPSSKIGHYSPPPEEMHPIRYHQSTVKKPQLNAFIAGREPQTEPARAKRAFEMVEGTPTKQHVNNSIQSPFSSPGFEFRFKRPSSELSDEAQRIMDQVREQAARIKVELAAQEAEQKLKDAETEGLYGVGGRKIAQAKGKVGRFSDVHMEEFKKMDSIANHPSKFRADPARAVPVTNLPKRNADVERSEAGSLKRTRSKADLQTNGTLLARSKSVKSLHREEEPESSSPAKRVRHNHTQETSAMPPISRCLRWDGSKSHTSLSPAIRSHSGIPTLPRHTGITTPTKASLARSASVKSLKSSSMIPSLVHSPSGNTLCSPSKGEKTEGRRKYRNTLAKLASLKGILRKPQPMFSDDPIKVAAGTHLAARKGTSNLDKDLPDLPPSTPSSEKKHVNFTNSAITKDEQSSAMKASRPSHVFELGTPTINYPSLPSPRLLEVLNYPSPVRVRASVPGDFTFRADKEISFGPATAGRVNEEKSALWHVRNSDASALLKSAVVDGREMGLEAIARQLPCVPHGLPNKKRRYSSVAEDDEGDEGKENRGRREDSLEGEGRRKRVKSSAGFGGGGGYGVFGKGNEVKVGSRIPKAKSKGHGILSLSRLNALARPKERR